MGTFGDIAATGKPSGDTIDVGILGNWFPIVERHARLKTGDAGNQILAFNGEDYGATGVAPGNCAFWVSPMAAAIPGRFLKFRLVTGYYLNRIGTGLTITMGLQRLDAVGTQGTVDQLGARIGGTTTRSMATLSVAEPHIHEGPEFDLDAVADFYVLVANLSAPMPADARIRVVSQLQYRWA